MMGARPLGDVLRDARAAGDALDQTFTTPVILMLPEGIALEGPTVALSSSAQAGPAPTSFDVPGTLVVAVRRKFNQATGPISFGRSSVCDVVLPFTMVSKHHGDLEERLGVWHLTDVGSTNGTVVDGKPVLAGGTMLLDRSVIRFGHVFAQFLGARAFREFLRARL